MNKECSLEKWAFLIEYQDSKSTGCERNKSWYASYV
jgi:hypothetical protein